MRRNRLSLRTRITAGALVVVVGAFSIAGLAILASAEQEMTHQIDTALRADAASTNQMLASGSTPALLDGPVDLYIQFVDRSNRVVGSGATAAGRPSLSAPDQESGSIASVHDSSLGELRVLVVGVTGSPDLRMVMARSSRSVGEVLDSLRWLLASLILVGSVFLGGLVWMVVGRSLRPVEYMRRTVERLDDSRLQTRVSLPGTRDELDQLARTLNEMLERLERAVEREHRFVADASHDLRTPLAAMRAILETEPTDPLQAMKTRADALARLDQLQTLVEQLLALARSDGGAERPMHPVDLDDLVLVQARLLARRAPGLKVDTSMVSGGQVTGHEPDLDRLVENLASNAARYAESTVSFGVRQVASTVELTVDDDGPGIAHGDRELIFERFRTLDDSRTHSGSGAGLGLSIVANIVAAHHGTVTVGDSPSGGARFTVGLPASMSEIPDDPGDDPVAEPEFPERP